MEFLRKRRDNIIGICEEDKSVLFYDYWIRNVSVKRREVWIGDLNDSDEKDMVVDGGEDTCGSSNSSEKMNSDTEDSESEEVPVLPQSDSEEDINFEINDFVVTKFTTEEDNRCRLYLGKIMEIGISECNISFLRKKIGAKETYFYFPEVPDICKCKKNIIKKVKCADIRRGRIALKNASKTLLDKLN
ncbi:hypothetical protein FQA39_LY03495 [Lamprigera yunnana]|nr:hypothetical protein FQA39_LY03495 [Lamprigera yunnana]